jgi:uncharacterized RDD family membrane protein YckC
VDGDQGRVGPSLRASDADRERVLALVNHALTTGQLTPDEHGDRVDATLQAKTVEELHRVIGDLVPGAVASPQVHAPAPPGWYADPRQPGLQRYFDGVAWSPHLAVPMGPSVPVGWATPPWKGARLGLPAQGSGALADPARRLGARLLDGLLLLPVVAGLVALAVVLVAPHAGPIFPRVARGRLATTATPGFVWIELAVLGALVVSGAVVVAYETVATARYGRTLGKAWLHIRPRRADGAPVGWGRAFGRAALYWVSGIFTWLGLLDPLWCLWDENRQCLHDKAAGTVVVNDLADAGTDAGAPVASPRAAGVGTGMPPQSWTVPVAGPASTPYPLAPYSPQYGYWGGPPAVPRTNGLAVASLVCSLSAIFFLGLPAIAGVVLGFFSRAQLHDPRRFEKGEGMALAGIVVGFCVIAFWAFVLTIPVLAGHPSS